MMLRLLFDVQMEDWNLVAWSILGVVYKVLLSCCFLYIGPLFSRRSHKQYYIRDGLRGTYTKGRFP